MCSLRARQANRRTTPTGRLRQAVRCRHLSRPSTPSWKSGLTFTAPRNNNRPRSISCGAKFMATQEDRRAHTRRKILDAAAELFAKHGYENTTIAQIVEKADLAKGTFYQHFQTKVDLLVALGWRDSAERVRNLIGEVQQGASPLDVLRRFYAVMAQWFEAHAPIAEDVILSAIRLHDPDSCSPEFVSHDFTRLMLQIAQQRGEVRADIDPSTQAIVIGGAFTLAVVDWSKKPQPKKLQKSLADCFQTFLYGAAPVNARPALRTKTTRR